jgi:hypothetical protein
MNDYPPDRITFDVRITCPADDLVRVAYRLSRFFDLLGVDWEHPASPIEFGADHRDHDLQEAFERRCD